MRGLRELPPRSLGGHRPPGPQGVGLRRFYFQGSVFGKGRLRVSCDSGWVDSNFICESGMAYSRALFGTNFNKSGNLQENQAFLE